MSSPRIGGALLGLILSTAPVSAGEVPRLLADVNREPVATAPRGEPSGFFELGGRLLFSTADPGSLDQAILWSTDGTARGTVQLSTALCTAHCSGIVPLGTWHGITLLRVTIDYGVGFEAIRLGRTDGTAVGTFLLTGDLSNPNDYVPLTIQIPPGGGGFLFSACLSSVDPCQLWRSDGTRAGTAPFLGADSLPFVDPRGFAVWRGRLYFVASRSAAGDPGLWSTDGTPEGTRFIHDARDLGVYRPGPVVATPSHLFFTSGESGEDLWATDGSPEGTHLLADFAPPSCDGGCPLPDVDSITADGDAVYFEAQPPGHRVEIWRSDGTEQGTGPLIELPPRVVWARGLQRIAGHWLFEAARGDESPSLWTVDDGFTQAAPLRDCAGGSCPQVDQPAVSPAPGVWLLTGFDGRGFGLWSTDGTGTGTRRLAGVSLDFSLSPGGPDVFPGPLGPIYFRACPAGDFCPAGTELWVTDGTLAGTHRTGGQVAGVGFHGGLAWFGSSPEGQQPASELWATDGTAGGARRVKTLRRYRPGSDPWFQPFRDGALFATFSPASQNRLWASDGTPGGTLPIQEEPSGHFQRFFQGFLGAGNPVQLFTVYRQREDGDPKAATELWRTDGTPRGTRSLALLPSFVESWLSWNGGTVFVNYELPDGCSLWRSDGTAAGTRQTFHQTGGLTCPFGLIALGSRFLFFSLALDAAGAPAGHVFLSDGTPAGTRRIASFAGRTFGIQPVEIEGTVYFQVLSDTSAELWRTDGTPAGTRLSLPLSGVGDLHVFRGSLYLTASLSPEPDGGRGLFRVAPRGEPVLLARVLRYNAYSLYDPLSFALAGDRLLFLFEDKQTGAELWATDGTPEGTGRLRRFQPFVADPIPEPDGLVSAGDRVFFAAGDGIHGRELWESDGTPEGTRMVVDLAPGGYSGLPAPSSLALSNGFLFFSADNGTTGFEPWALRLEP
jgi:ELWxxDGT repeat protein